MEIATGVIIFLLIVIIIVLTSIEKRLININRCLDESGPIHRLMYEKSAEEVELVKKVLSTMYSMRFDKVK